MYRKGPNLIVLSEFLEACKFDRPISRNTKSNDSKQPGDPDSGTEDELDVANTARHPRNLASNKSACNSTKNYILGEKGVSHRQHFGKWDELLQIS